MARDASASSTNNRVPHQGTGEWGSTADPPRPELPAGWDGRVAFDRLLSVAKLTPAQATLVAVQLLDAADRRSVVEGEAAHDARLGAVTLLPSGEVDVECPGDGEGTRTGLLLEQLLQNARQLPAHPAPEQLLVLHTLEEVVGDSSHRPGTRSRELEHSLAGTLGSGGRQRVTAQLAALVEAFAHVAPSVGAPSLRGVAVRAPVDLPAAPRPAGPGAEPVQVPRPAPAPTDASRAAPARAARARHLPRRPLGRGRTLLRRGRGRRAALVVLVLAAVLASSGYLVVRGPGVGFFASIGNAVSPAAPDATATPRPSKPSAQPPRRHHSPAVPALAGRQAGRITGVTVQKNGSCRPGTPCPVTVTVHLRPASASQPITWRVGAARLCTRGIAWSPPTTVTAQPGWTSVYAASSVRVPQGRSLALVAVTSAPAKAQSRPVPVLGSSLRC